MRKYSIIITLCTILLTCQSCSNEDYQAELSTKSQSQIQISNDGNQFEYWLDQEHYNSDGETISVIVDKGTQITICSVVLVISGVIMIPNVKVCQDNKIIDIRQINEGLFWYEVK